MVDSLPHKSKIEGENLAVYSCTKTNTRYLYGTKFDIVTDHEPLVPLYNNPARPATVRIDRHRSKLRQFDFKLVYEPGTTSPDILLKPGNTLLVKRRRWV